MFQRGNLLGSIPDVDPVTFHNEKDRTIHPRCRCAPGTAFEDAGHRELNGASGLAMVAICQRFKGWHAGVRLEFAAAVAPTMIFRDDYRTTRLHQLVETQVIERASTDEESWPAAQTVGWGFVDERLQQLVVLR